MPIDCYEEFCVDGDLQFHARDRGRDLRLSFDKGCNIVDSSQFDDLETGRFFMRVSFISEEGEASPP